MEATNQSQTKPITIAFLGTILALMGNVNTVVDSLENAQKLIEFPSAVIENIQNFQQKAKPLVDELSNSLATSQQPTEQDMAKANYIKYLGWEIVKQSKPSLELIKSDQANLMSEEELAAAKKLEKHISSLESELEKLESLTNRINASRYAAEFLDTDLKRDELARAAAKAVLVKQPENQEFFYQKISLYLKLIYHSLDMCSTELLDEAIKRKSISLGSQIPYSVYIEALNFIKNQNYIPILTNDDAQNELNFYLDYLSKKLPDMSIS
jgi:hypothetical protein